jgi:hypothetical protein
VARLAQQLAVLLLRHALAALLDDRTHEYLTKIGERVALARGGTSAKSTVPVRLGRVRYRVLQNGDDRRLRHTE